MAEKPLTDDEIRALRAMLAATTLATPKADRAPTDDWCVPPLSDGWV